MMIATFVAWFSLGAVGVWATNSDLESADFAETYVRRHDAGEAGYDLCLGCWMTRVRPLLLIVGFFSGPIMAYLALSRAPIEDRGA
jgi:hypothetical protein